VRAECSTRPWCWCSSFSCVSSPRVSALRLYFHVYSLPLHFHPPSCSSFNGERHRVWASGTLRPLARSRWRLGESGWPTLERMGIAPTLEWPREDLGRVSAGGRTAAVSWHTGSALLQIFHTCRRLSVRWLAAPGADSYVAQGGDTRALSSIRVGVVGTGTIARFGSA
jgi:hypothetical protein